MDEGDDGMGLRNGDVRKMIHAYMVPCIRLFPSDLRLTTRRTLVLLNLLIYPFLYGLYFFDFSKYVL